MRFDPSTMGWWSQTEEFLLFQGLHLRSNLKKNLWGSWEDLEKSNNYNLQIKIVLISADSTKLSSSRSVCFRITISIAMLTHLEYQ